MKVIIAGTRYKDLEMRIPFDDYGLIVQAVERSGFNMTELVCGMAIGVDKLGEQYAINRSIPVKEMPARWDLYCKKAGPLRNKAMAEYADAAVVIWDGVSEGTRNMIDCMIKFKKPYYIAMTASNLESFF